MDLYTRPLMSWSHQFHVQIMELTGLYKSLEIVLTGISLCFLPVQTTGALNPNEFGVNPGSNMQPRHFSLVFSLLSASAVPPPNSSLCCWFVCSIMSPSIHDQQVKLPLHVYFPSLFPSVSLHPASSFFVISAPIREIPYWSMDPPPGSTQCWSPGWWHNDMRVSLCSSQKGLSRVICFPTHIHLMHAHKQIPAWKNRSIRAVKDYHCQLWNSKYAVLP